MLNRLGESGVEFGTWSRGAEADFSTFEVSDIDEAEISRGNSVRFSSCVFCTHAHFNPSQAHDSVTMEAKPSRLVPSPDDIAGEGGGPQKEIEEKRGMVKEQDDAGIKLGLGVGFYSAEAISLAISRAEKNQNPLFTEAQRRELEHQAFIFRHFVYKLPVPHKLVLPILRSVIATSDSGFPGICKQFPSLRVFRYLDLGNWDVEDDEPHRCRRTDGKKWRCRGRIVPGLKYCERHKHRGCRRICSRKPVETSEVNCSSLTNASANLHAKLSSNPKNEFSVPVSKSSGIHLINTPIFTPSNSHCDLDSAINRHKNILGSPESMASPRLTLATAAVSTAVMIRRTESIASNDKSNLNFFKKDDIAKSCIRHSNNGVPGSGIRNITNDSNFSTGIGFSPRSVLQGNTVSGSHHSLINHEPDRCRRTDGRKWRCRRAVLPDQKYCATHMHRGAKKREPSSSLPLSSTTITIAQLPSTAAATANNIQRAYHTTIPNTNLSMSIPESSPLAQCEERKSPSSSTSCDTDITISDTINDCSYATFSEAASKLEETV
ncbi:growth-regulating factor 9-like isoform X1 [Senna tora]|uniref:Growth-regulating factor n=1 Tax=Senna tora TaxID=362788 RepID=A0A834TS82_9FABA|nr:growth-regulating factor 9-like isoform X1 [Senna tora]